MAAKNMYAYVITSNEGNFGVHTSMTKAITKAWNELWSWGDLKGKNKISEDYLTQLKREIKDKGQAWVQMPDNAFSVSVERFILDY